MKFIWIKEDIGKRKTRMTRINLAQVQAVTVYLGEGKGSALQRGAWWNIWMAGRPAIRTRGTQDDIERIFR